MMGKSKNSQESDAEDDVNKCFGGDCSIVISTHQDGPSRNTRIDNKASRTTFTLDKTNRPSPVTNMQTEKLVAHEGKHTSRKRRRKRKEKKKKNISQDRNKPTTTTTGSLEFDGTPRGSTSWPRAQEEWNTATVATPRTQDNQQHAARSHPPTWAPKYSDSTEPVPPHTHRPESRVTPSSRLSPRHPTVHSARQHSTDTTSAEEPPPSKNHSTHTSGEAYHHRRPPRPKIQQDAYDHEQDGSDDGHRRNSTHQDTAGHHPMHDHHLDDTSMPHI